MIRLRNLAPDLQAMVLLASYGMALSPTGKVYYVDSGHPNAGTGKPGTDPNNPLSTLDEAIGKCTANNGDIIVISPGHAETLTAAGAITFDVAGVTVLGIGNGTTRPQFTLGTAVGVDIDVTAANVTIVNCEFIANLASIVHCFDVTAAGFQLIDCVSRDAATNKEFIDFIDCSSTTDNNADRLTIIRHRHYGQSTTDDGFIEANADIDRLTIKDSYIALGVADGEAAVMCATGKDLTNLEFVNNRIRRANTASAVAINSDTTANTGIVAYNVIHTADSASAVPFDVTGVGHFENYQLGVATDASGLLLPAVDDNA